jgi:TonB family protein
LATIFAATQSAAAQSAAADAESHFEKATAFHQKSDVEAEIAELREAIRLKPDFAEAHLNLGLALFKRREKDAAINEYREVIRLKPDLPEAHLALGIALAWKADPNGAIAEYREATRLKPDYEEAHRYLGHELMSLRKRQEGLDELETARALKPQVSPELVSGLLVKKIKPKYPEKARQAGIQGQVVLHAEITKEGNIGSLTLLSGDPTLASAAIDAVKKWKYKPYLLDGEPVSVETKIIVNFFLSGGVV